MQAISPSAALIALARWGAARDWVGADPYEGLNTRVGRMTRSRRSRQIAIQLYKRAPFTPVGPAAAAPQPNAKALALALSGYATPAGRDLDEADRFLRSLPARLEGLNLDPVAAAWGYHFDVQTRHLFYSRTTPNAIATCFVVDALIDLHQASGEEAPARLAERARPFLLELLVADAGADPYFGYVPGGSRLIHNANLLVCGALARLHELVPAADAERDRVAAAVRTSIGRQRPDGLWPYGEGAGLEWADNFHTAYVLTGLLRVRRAFGIGAGALERGVPAWQQAFLEPDGWARYYPARRHPLEAHSCASAIDLLCLLAGDREGATPLAMARRVAESAIAELWLPREGRFAFRRTRRGLNRREFMRWTNAPMFRALAALVSLERQGER